jgi:soluble lytic murein transglycosylase
MKHICAHHLSFLVVLACASSAPAIAKTGPVPLPDRNPERPAPTLEQAATADAAPSTNASATTEAPSASSETAAAPAPEAPATPPSEDGNATTIAAIPKPKRSPQKASETGGEDGAQNETTAPAEGQGESQAEATGPFVAPENAPLPDINPNRDPMSPKAPEPALNYASILEPLLSYEISSADENRMRFVMRHKGSVDETAAKISDPAVRDFGFWYRYKHNKSSYLNAEAIEAYRLSHAMWPSQDKLREKAETSLFLTDASPERIKAFFNLKAP